MSSSEHHHHHHHHTHGDPHDWHSRTYVDDWIARDLTRDAERRRALQQALASVSFSEGTAIRVLDVGGGYGMFTEEVLKRFPYATITLQDYSKLMTDHARERLSRYGDRITYALCDLSDPTWASKVGGPFDLAVSAIALHNLRDMALIAVCYRSIFGILVPGGAFVNCDHFASTGVDAHLEALHGAGFGRTTYTWLRPENTSIVALRESATAAVS